MKQIVWIATIVVAVAAIYFLLVGLFILLIVPLFPPDTGQLLIRIFALLGLAATLICALRLISRWVKTDTPAKLASPPPVTSAPAGDFMIGCGEDCPVSQVRPWVRYCARFVDIVLSGFCFGAVLSIIAPSVLKVNKGILNILFLFVWCFVEAVCLSMWGTTPGKSLLRVTVRNADRSKLNFRSALSRSVDVWIRGLGIGFPLAGLITLAIAYNTLSKNGITTWDQSRNFRVIHEKIGSARVIFTIVLFAGYFSFLVFNMMQT